MRRTVAWSVRWERCAGEEFLLYARNDRRNVRIVLASTRRLPTFSGYEPRAI